MPSSNSKQQLPMANNHAIAMAVIVRLAAQVH